MNLGDPIAFGNTAEIYLKQNKIIKIYKDDLPETESLKEADKQRFAYSCGLPVPQVLEVTKINGKQALIMEYSRGKTLGELLLENREQAEYYLDISVDIQQKIHMAFGNSIEPMQDKLRRQIESVQDLDRRHKTFLLNKLDSLTYPPRLCHGDFHLFNVIMSGTGFTIIDWVDASMGDIRADVYRTYLLYTQFSEDIAEIYLRLYCEKSGLPTEEIFQWAPIISGARLSEMVSTEKSERLMNIIKRYCP